MNEKVSHFFPGRPIPLGDVLKEYLEKEGLVEPIKIYQLVGEFKNFFPKVSRFCQCDEYRNGVLYLSLKDPIFCIEVQKSIPEVRRVYQEKGLIIKKVKIRGIPKNR